MKLLAINAIVFQAGWFACVLGGNVVAVFTTAAILFMHSKFFMASSDQWWLIASFGVIGLLVDGTLSFMGILNFAYQPDILIPIWLLCLWLLFATTLCHSLAWAQSHIFLASVLGAIAGPSSYFAGSKLSSVSFAEPIIGSLLIIGLCWAIIFPGGLWLARRCR